MSSPFRKLIRIAVIIISLLLLFNFFGYYFLKLRSEENEHMLRVVNVAGRQRVLTDAITKDILWLSKNPLRPSNKELLLINLHQSVQLLEKNNRYLLQQISLPGVP